MSFGFASQPHGASASDDASVAKIRNKYYNQNNSSEKKPSAEEIFKKDIAVLEKKEQEEALNKQRQVSLTMKQKMDLLLSVSVPRNLLPIEYLDRLRKDGKDTVGSLVLAGEEYCASKLKGLMPDIDVYLRMNYGISIYERIKAVLPSVFEQMNDRIKTETVRRDLFDSLSRFPTDMEDETIFFPISLSGAPFKGEAGALLYVKTASYGPCATQKNQRWQNAVFATAGELLEKNIKLLPSAIPTHVKTETGFLTLYNIDETNLREIDPYYYKSITESQVDSDSEIKIRINKYKLLSYNKTKIIYEHLAGLYSRDVERGYAKDRDRADFHVDLDARTPVDRNSPEYMLATETTMFLAGRLNELGIQTVIVDDETARTVYKGKAPGAEFSVADIMKLNYVWNGDDISPKTFAQEFMPLIKQKDRTVEDAERIATAYIAAVKEHPEGFIAQLKPENMSHARYFGSTQEERTEPSAEEQMHKPESPERERIEQLNQAFNEALDKLKNKTDLSEGVINLGMPSVYLRSAGIPNISIQVREKTLHRKSINENHPYKLDDIKDLVLAIQKPWVIFRYGDEKKAQNLIVGIQREEKHFLVGLSLIPVVGGKYMEINSVRNVFPKDDKEWLLWIQQGKAIRIDEKEKIQAVIRKLGINHHAFADLDLDSVANLHKNLGFLRQCT